MRVDLDDVDMVEDAEIKKDAQVMAFFTSTRAQRHTWIDNNVNSVADVKTFLKRLADMIVVIGRKVIKG